ncbi:hypothetical protein M0R36_03995 [bacterium]|jgi:hypothetical protein|nr:hypothetical protein [bacterium]
MKKKKSAPFVMLNRRMIIGKDWFDLTNSEKITYVYLKRNYTGLNNGDIPLTYTQMRPVFKDHTFSKALKGLIKKGWIERTKKGGLFGGMCRYKLTGKFDPDIRS